MMFHCLWNMWVKHVQASLVSLLRLLLWPLSHSFYLTVTTDRLLLSPSSKTVTLTLSCQLFMSKCPALSLMPSPLTAHCLGFSLWETPLFHSAFCTLADRIQSLFLSCFYLCNKPQEAVLHSEFYHRWRLVLGMTWNWVPKKRYSSDFLNVFKIK